MLTSAEIMFILMLLQEKYGSGYSKDTKVSRLQAKLSVMLELAYRKGESDKHRRKD